MVCMANVELNIRGLATGTWGNVSGIDRDKNLVAIKPSGIAYSDLTSDKIVILELGTGKKVEGDLNPSSDTPTHLELYRNFPVLGGITHTHSSYATSFAQAMQPIPCMGTTHADYFYGEIPVTRKLTPAEIAENYEFNTGKLIAELWLDKKEKVLDIPAVLVAQHGPFTWGKSATSAVEAAVVLEEIAKMAFMTFAIDPGRRTIEKELLDKHFFRKHGTGAYYGQK